MIEPSELPSIAELTAEPSSLELQEYVEIILKVLTQK